MRRGRLKRQRQRSCATPSQCFVNRVGNDYSVIRFSGGVSANQNNEAEQNWRSQLRLRSFNGTANLLNERPVLTTSARIVAAPTNPQSKSAETHDFSKPKMQNRPQRLWQFGPEIWLISGLCRDATDSPYQPKCRAIAPIQPKNRGDAFALQCAWRPEPESNRRARICSPLRNHSAIGPHA